jgi:hypothetical protein
VGIPITGMRDMISATHNIPVNCYLGDVIIPFGKALFRFQKTPLMEFSPHAGAPFQIITWPGYYLPWDSDHGF